MLVVQVVGKHNSGKTTLIEYLVSELERNNLKVGYVKHDPKGKGRTDKENSDTWRVKPKTLRAALVSPEWTTLWIKGNLSLERVLKLFDGLDLVIVEGFKSEKGFPKILVGEEEFDLPKEDVVLTVKGKEDYEKALNWILERLEG